MSKRDVQEGENFIEIVMEDKEVLDNVWLKSDVVKRGVVIGIRRNAEDKAKDSKKEGDDFPL